MDVDHFTRLLRLLATTPSRRTVGRTALSLTVGSILAPLLTPTDAEAKKRKKNKKKKAKPCPGGLKRCGGACVDVSSDAANCGDCGKQCASGQQCAEGRCPGGACDFQVSTVRELQDAIVDAYLQQKRVVCLAPGDYHLTNPNPAELELGELTEFDLKFYDIALRDTHLLGADAETTALIGSGNGWAAVISGGGYLQGLSITGGQRRQESLDLGGGIENLGGDLTIVDCTVSGNSAPDGGGIFNGDFGDLTLIRSTITGNIANRPPDEDLGIKGGLAGGLFNAQLGLLTRIDTTISGNTQAEGPDCFDLGCACAC